MDPLGQVQTQGIQVRSSRIPIGNTCFFVRLKSCSFPLSPAHVAFVTPTLAHTNAIQSYRATIVALSGFPPGGWFCTTIYTYWCICLFVGTIVNFIFTYKFLIRLLEWTRVDVAGEEAPPPPYETMTHELIDERGAHDTMMAQTFVSPAVLEANESGALMRVRRGTEDFRLYSLFSNGSFTDGSFCGISAA